MSNTVIRVENLGKKYIIGHQKSERYTTLRDAIANSAKYLTSKLLKPTVKEINDPNYEEFWALKDVSFEIKQGDRVGIIGRNGAGKSTLLKILTRITEPTCGRISIRGRVASLLEVGTGFHPELTGRENIYLNGAILGMSKIEIKKKFDEIVAFAEVEKFLDTPVKRYSSGMYVRLAFAVAAHLEPEILVVDEVLAVGDIQFQKKCLGKMEDVSAKEGRTVLFVSHNMQAVETLCNTVIRLKNGQIESIGDSFDQIQAYLKNFVQVTKSSLTKPLDISLNYSLKSFAIEPEEITPGDLAKFTFIIAGKNGIKITELALLVYSIYNYRVAVIDLREGIKFMPSSTDLELCVSGKINHLPLVEGEYTLGLYLRTEDFHNDILDIISFSVKSLIHNEPKDFIAYKAAQRGIIVLEHSFQHTYSINN